MLQVERDVSLDRRTFCACALGLAAMACGGGGDPAPAPPPVQPSPGLKTTTDTKAGLLSTPSGTVRDYRNLGSFFLVRDAAGIYALTAICTHQGCSVGSSGDQFACPCHGSTYDLNGGNLGGPAPAPLVHFAVTEPSPGAMLVVDTSQVVTANQRLA